MRLLDVILSFLAQALWPLVTLLLAGGALLSFRKELRRLLYRRVHAKYGDVEVTIDPEEEAMRWRVDLEKRISLVEGLLPTAPPATPQPPASFPAPSPATERQIAAVEEWVLQRCKTPYTKTTIQSIAAALQFEEAVVLECATKSSKIQLDTIPALAAQGFVHPR